MEFNLCVATATTFLKPVLALAGAKPVGLADVHGVETSVHPLPGWAGECPEGGALDVLLAARQGGAHRGAGSRWLGAAVACG